MIQAAKLIGIGLATTGLIGADVGIGVVFTLYNVTCLLINIKETLYYMMLDIVYYIIFLLLVSIFIHIFNIYDILTLFNGILDSIIDSSTILSSGLQGEGGNGSNPWDPTPTT